MKSKNIELEDLLPESLVKEATAAAASDFLKDEEVKSITAKVDNSKPFGEYFREMCLGISDENFKGAVKSALNNRIAEKIGQTKTKAEFDKTFEAYSSWTQSVIKKIAEQLEIDRHEKQKPPQEIKDLISKTKKDIKKKNSVPEKT